MGKAKFIVSMIGCKLFLHNIQTLPGFGVVRQVLCQCILNHYPALGNDGEDNGNDRNQKKQIPLVDNEGRKLDHEAVLFLGLIFFAHTPIGLLWSMIACLPTAA